MRYNDTISEIQEDATEVISYKDIFNNYYEYACKQLDLLDDDYVLTFNDSINGYYYNGFNNNEEVSVSDGHYADVKTKIYNICKQFEKGIWSL